jgi:hypothetical protein
MDAELAWVQDLHGLDVGPNLHGRGICMGDGTAWMQYLHGCITSCVDAGSVAQMQDLLACTICMDAVHVV